MAERYDGLPLAAYSSLHSIDETSQSTVLGAGMSQAKLVGENPILFNLPFHM